MFLILENNRELVWFTEYSIVEYHLILSVYGCLPSFPHNNSEVSDPGLSPGTSGGRPVDWMDSQGEEVTIWKSMLERPNVWIDGTLILRPSMEGRK